MNRTKSHGIFHEQGSLKLNPPDTDNKQTWNALTALDREVIMHLVQSDAGPIYHKEQYKKFGEKMGAKVGQGAVQASINRLRDQGILIKIGHGQWGFENSGFKIFVQDRQT